MTHGLALAGIVIVLLLLRQNIVLTLGIAVAFIHAYMAKNSAAVFLIQDVWFTVAREVLLSIPMFIFAGNIMARGSIAARLTRIMGALTASIPGGLGIATVLSMAGFSAISGSSIVTMMAVGTIMYPALLKSGYSKSYALGMLCSGGTLGIIIPPSLLMIVYGFMTEVSITELFLAGWGPGLLLTAGLCVYTWVVNRRLPTGEISGAEIAAAFRNGIAALLMPVILLGGIYSGVMTPTEAAAVAAAYAFLVAVLWYRNITARDTYGAVLNSARATASIGMLIAGALVFNYVVTIEQIPLAVKGLLAGYDFSATMFLIAVNVILLVLGCLLEGSTIILVVLPIFIPTAKALGIDLVHFGVVAVFNIMIGLVTPPYGLLLFIISAISGAPLRSIIRDTMPFVLAMIVALAIITFVPETVLWLPRLMGYKG
jgi:tripartite ATP-independent transporter DctM subunit